MRAEVEHAAADRRLENLAGKGPGGIGRLAGANPDKASMATSGVAAPSYLAGEQSQKGSACSMTSSVPASSVGGTFSIVLRAAARRRTDRTST
jgi:hypothetical protein